MPYSTVELIRSSILRGRSRRIQARLMARGERSVVLTRPESQCFALCGPDPSKPGRWRWTRFDGDGPVGHSEAPSLEAAIAEALWEGYGEV